MASWEWEWTHSHTSVPCIGEPRTGHHTPDAASQMPERRDHFPEAATTSLELLAVFLLIELKKLLAFDALIWVAFLF